ncbi:MAG: hypothetical protein Q8K75_07200 [Chlamydiales bacterium]|nr:hypothetical protein [Chlamydiales bacterium]
MTVGSIDLSSVNTYQAVTEYTKNPKDISLLAKIGYATLCDAKTHSLQAASGLPLAIFFGHVSQPLLHLKRALSHLTLLAVLPFSLVKADCVTSAADFLGLNNPPPSAKVKTATVAKKHLILAKTHFLTALQFLKENPRFVLGVGVGTGITLGALGYVVTREPSRPLSRPAPPDVSIIQAIFLPIAVVTASLYITDKISRIL